MSNALTGALTRERIRNDIAEVLEIPVADVDDTANLLDEGLDSVRVMTLLERWRESGAQVDLVDLISDPTVDAWADILDVN
ncbi:phosphopantetheine-binding protein [Rhodococcus sp. NPDC058521]|uniref:phosphopantetheine-binding protein n=1 Tax=Rhodococcus sp. NPDC058521 TaxID=3346536 RepID=UPI00364CD325